MKEKPADKPIARSPRKTAAWKKAVPYVLVAGVLGAIVLGLLPKPIEVETAWVSRGPLTVSVLEEGKTRIRNRYVISAPITGLLNRVPLRAGARIEKDQTILATIQPQPASFLDPRAQAESRARLQAAEAAKDRASAEVDRAQAALDLAEKDRERNEALRRTGAISAREWDESENRATLRRRELRVAEFALRVAEFERAQAEAAMVQITSPVDAETKPLELRSPVNGVVLNVYEENARLVTPGMPIMEVGDPADLEAEIELLSSDAVAVSPGDPVWLEQWGGAAPLRGKVALIEPGGYTKTSALGVEEQRVKVRVDFVDPLPVENPLGDRYRVEARIVTWSAPDVLQIPTGALFRRGEQWMTFRVRNGRAELVKVGIAHNSGVAAEVRSGVAEGDRVILHPPDTIREGVAVRSRENPQ